jgi:hypothetical protein
MKAGNKAMQKLPRTVPGRNSVDNIMTPLVFTDQSDITEVHENSTNYYASQIKNT